MLAAPSEFGRCLCGAELSPRDVQVNMKVHDVTVTLRNVPQGLCGECDSRVYKAGVLRRIEMVMSGIRE